jgi:hypothetical protein
MALTLKRRIALTNAATLLLAHSTEMLLAKDLPSEVRQILEDELNSRADEEDRLWLDEMTLEHGHGGT